MTPEQLRAEITGLQSANAQLSDHLAQLNVLGADARLVDGVPPTIVKDARERYRTAQNFSQGGLTFEQCLAAAKEQARCDAEAVK